jgi:hypothetical protein
MYSARVLAISVLPVPVGPTNRKTPSGRAGLDERDPLDEAVDRLRLADDALGEEAADGLGVEGGVGVEHRERQPRRAREHAQHVGGVDVLAAGLGGLLRRGADERQQRAGWGDARQELLGQLARLREQLARRPHADPAAVERVGADGLGGGAAEHRDAHRGEQAREARPRLDEELPRHG